MSAAKINIKPSKNYRIKVRFSLSDILKEEFVDLGDSYYLEVVKRCKKANLLTFSILINKKLLTRGLIKEGNPSFQIQQKGSLASINISFELLEQEVKQGWNTYEIQRENIEYTTFKLHLRVTSPYYSKKILDTRYKLFNEKPFNMVCEEEINLFQPPLREKPNKSIRKATDTSYKKCESCYFRTDEYICGVHNEKVNNLNVCSRFYQIKVVSGGAVSPK